ncbi:MAG: hypothetical protein PHQ04_06340 [Opitutaceae bacterium]|nr:hypothetical protein [Opitutaceae bacterium]
MRIGRWQIKRRVMAGVFGGVLVTLIWLLWTRQMRPPMTSAPDRLQPFVQVLGGGGRAADQILKERTEFFDPTPLFYPTEKSYEQRELPASLRPQTGEVFEMFPEILSFGEQNIPVWGAASVQAPKRLTDVLAQGAQAPFAGFEREDVQMPPLPERVAQIEVTALFDGKVVINQSISDEIKPPRRDIEPVEFLVAINPAGFVGELMPTSGAAPEDVVNFFSDYLGKDFHLGLRLPPGTYRVMIGP